MIRRALIAGLALACGCTDDAIPNSGPLKGDLSVDIRDQAEVEIRGQGPALEATVKLSKGFGLAPDGAALTGKGREEAFPEAAMTLYTARFDAPPSDGGPCGGSPVSLALSLHMRKGSRASGSLTAYCGAGVFHGEPARVLRLAGDLKR
jgi:hypothetical protein